MEEQLTKQDIKFVKTVVETGNQTLAAQKAYDIKDPNYAGVKGHKNIRKDKIRKAIITLADSIPDKLLVKVHLEGLEAGKTIYKNNVSSGEIEEVGYEVDYATRHKYLESGYKLKGAFAPEKSISINLDVEEETLRQIIKSIK